MNSGDNTLIYIASFAIFILVITAIVWVHEWFKQRAIIELSEIYTGLGASSQKREGYCRVKFPAYIGTLILLQEITQEVWVSPSNVKNIVYAMIRFNFKYGLLSIFAPYVILLVMINYFTHLSVMTKAKTTLQQNRV